MTPPWANSATGSSSGRRLAADLTRPEMVNNVAISEDILNYLGSHGLDVFMENGAVVLKLKVATVCSGIEAPLFALRSLQQALQNIGNGLSIEFHQVFACEVEKHKQEIIRLNADRTDLKIFRDVVELSLPGAKQAMVADGHLEDIPTDYDLLVAGCACVDFSTLNMSKPNDSPIFSKVVEKYGKDALDGKEDGLVPFGLDEEFVKLLGELAITDCGASFKTFLATLQLLATHRPKMFIMENVLQAPWQAMTRFWLRKIGYLGKQVSVDSKNFYIPQTRNRGYLLAVDYELYGPSSALRITENWADIMSTFQKTYSATADKFLLPPSDPRIIKARRDEESRAGRSKESEWDYSRDRHDEVRRNEGLRGDNLYTEAEFIGPRVVRMQPHQRSSQLFLRGQPPRVLDFLDINHERGFRNEVDPGYKFFMGNVSQNVDFGEGWHDLLAGLMSCITPDAMAFRSDEHRLVYGIEVLHLQGFPIDNFIVPPGVRNSQIQDVAGNTMTTTVVGVAMLAALISIHRTKPTSLTLLPDHNPPQKLILPDLPRDLVEYRNETARRAGEWTHDLVSVPNYNTSSCRVTTVADAIDHLLRGRRYCFCADYVRPANQESRILVCQDCGETACKDCHGNPPHQFVPFTTLTAQGSKLLAAEEVKKWVQLVFPGRFVLGMASGLSAKDLCKTTKSPDSSLPVFEAIIEALSDEVYYFHKVYITENITVEYKTKNTYARAVISTAGITWYIFLSREFRIWENIAEHHDLADPIARLVLAKNSSFIVPFGVTLFNWEIWAAHCREVEVHLAPLAGADGLEVVRVVSHDPDVGADAIYQKIAGPYTRKPGCGGAERSMHTHANGFMFKEVTKLGPAQADHIVFADTCRQLDLHEVREALLHMDADFKPHRYRVDKPCVELGYVRGHWVSAQGLIRLGPLQASSADQLHIGCREEFITACCPLEHQERGVFMDIRTPLLHLPIRDAAMARWEASRIRMDAQRNGNGSGTLFFSIPATEHRSVLREFAFALPALASYLQTLPSHLGQAQSLEFSDLCGNCGHKPPESYLLEFDQWEKKLSLKRKPAKAKGKKNESAPNGGTLPASAMSNVATNFKLRHKVLVTERPSDVDAFERAVKKRHPPVELAMRLDLAPQSPEQTVVSLALDDHHPISTNVTGKHEGIAGLRVSLHPMGLAQRAAAAIMYSRTQRELDQLSMSLSYEIDVNYRPDIQIEFPLFSGRLQSTDNDQGLPDVVAPRFRKNKMELQEAQVSAVAWMIEQENKPKSFQEREIVEFIIPEIHCRMTGTATHDVTCQGGVVAHDIGFGKTVCVLALVDHQAQRDDSVFYHHLCSEPDRIAVDATLILAPRSIVRQWTTEIRKFLGPDRRVLLIENYKQMTTKTVKQFREADFVVVATEVLDPPKGERGAKYSDTLFRMLGRKRWPRSFDDPVMDGHYRRGVENLPQVVAALLDDLDHGRANNLQETQRTLDSLVRADERLERDILTEAHVNDIEESAQQLGVPQSEITQTRQGIRKIPVLKQGHALILDLFAYNRIIWDEFSYKCTSAAKFMKNAVTGSKFLLSGTPPLRDVGDVCHTADVLGVHVARPQPSPPAGLPSVAQGPLNAAVSDAEKLSLLAEEYSPSAYAEVHRQAAHFVERFYRCNTVPSDRFVKIESAIPIRLPMAVALPYEDLSHSLARSGMNVFAISDEFRSTLDREIELGTDSKDLAAGALILRASGSVGHLYRSHSQASLDSQGLVNTLKSSAKSSLEQAAMDLKMSFDRFMFLRLAIAMDPERFLPSEADQSKYSLRTAVYNEFIRILTEPGRSKTSKAAANFGGSAIWRQIVTALTLRNSQDPSLFDPVRWGPHCWFGIVERGLAFFSPLDLYDISGVFDVDSRTGQITSDLREPLLRPLAAEVQLVKLRKKNPSQVNFLRHYQQSELLHVEELDKVEPRVRKWEEERLVKVTAAVAPLTTPPEAALLRGFLATKAKTKSDTGYLRSQCNRNGIKFKSTDDRDDLIERLVNSACGILSESEYLSGRQKCPTHEAFPHMGLVRVRSVQMSAMFEALQRSFHTVRNKLDLMKEAAKRMNFFELVSRLNSEDLDNPDFVNCESCSGTGPSGLSNSVILQACGHLICNACVKLRMKKNSKNCPVGDCQTPFYPEVLIRADRLVSQDDQKSLGALKTGPKVQTMVDFINTIKTFGSTDRIVIFVQYASLMDQVRRALAANHISNLGGKGAGSIADDIENFKDGMARVLLLELNTAQAAGSNLTIANHVIFLTPLVENDDYLFARIMRQAMGRCIRTGQHKTVFIHHLYCAETVEEAIVNSKLGNVDKFESTEMAVDLLGQDIDEQAGKYIEDTADVEKLEVADAGTRPLRNAPVQNALGSDSTGMAPPTVQDIHDRD